MDGLLQQQYHPSHDTAGAASRFEVVEDDVTIVEVDRERRCEVPVQSKGDDVYLPSVHQSIGEVEVGIASAQLPCAESSLMDGFCDWYGSEGTVTLVIGAHFTG